MASPEAAAVDARVADRTVTVMPSGLSFTTEPDETIMAAAVRHRLRWPTVCQGNAQCAACTFIVDGGSENLSPLGPDETTCLAGYARPVGVDPSRTFRLACRAKVTEGAVTLIKRGVRAAG